VKVDFRLVSATNRSLERLVKEGKFREDLLYRLNPFVIRVPALRERREDIRHLVASFLTEAGAPGRKLAPAASVLLEQHPFPGNIRQLKSAVVRAVALRADPITPEALGLSLDETAIIIEDAEAARRAHFLEVYEQCSKNASRAAEVLGVHRNTVSNVLGLWKKKSDC
jgi:DNA-binding NtrC family response regulator